MRPLTEQQVRRSFVNCSQGEAKGLALPEDFDILDWSQLELLGWRDPKAPLRGYLVVETDERPVGIAVRAEVVAERAAELRERVQAFVGAVRR
jgi:hypothetical protein